jgi:hypothetical protein
MMAGCAAFSLIKKAAAAANTRATRYKKSSKATYVIPISITCDPRLRREVIVSRALELALTQAASALHRYHPFFFSLRTQRPACGNSPSN